jgi:hypothetical protein
VKARLLLLVPVLAGCAAAPVYVSSSDPLLSICATPGVTGLSTLTSLVTGANDTNPVGSMDGYAVQMSPGQQRQVGAAAVPLRADAAELGSHPAVAQDMQTLAADYTEAAASSTGYVSNSLASQASSLTQEISAVCGNLRIGTAPPAQSGLSAWADLGIAVAGWTFLSWLTARMLAASERRRPKKKRMDAVSLFWASLFWFAGLSILLTRRLAGMLVTEEEKSEERIARAKAENERLEKQLRDGQ